MFDALSSKFGGILESLTRKGTLSEEDVGVAMREIRVALLEADVSLPVVKEFIEVVGQKAIGQDVVKSITPGQMVIKIVHDQLIEMLGSEDAEINFRASPPVPILIVGLQGAGKTTTAGKLALRLTKHDGKKVLLAGLDVVRPAAQEQLEILGGQAGVLSIKPVFGEQPIGIAKRAMETARKEGYDAVILDTAGRLSIDQELMAEVSEIRKSVTPVETLLVADALSGQDAVNTAREFNEKVGITGIVLTRVDGDSRGGAALSMRAVTGCPIKLIGVGEKLDALETFQAERIAGRILGMGDVVGLVEKAVEVIDEEEAVRIANRMKKATFDFNDFLAQMKMMQKMGPLEGILGMIPGAGKLKGLAGAMDEGKLKKVEAIVLSMTPVERKKPEILNGKRRLRIAKGSGNSITQVNQFLRQFGQMRKMMRSKGKMKKMLSQFGAGGMDMGGLGGDFPKGMKF